MHICTGLEAANPEVRNTRNQESPKYGDSEIRKSREPRRQESGIPEIGKILNQEIREIGEHETRKLQIQLTSGISGDPETGNTEVRSPRQRLSPTQGTLHT